MKNKKGKKTMEVVNEIWPIGTSNFDKPVDLSNPINFTDEWESDKYGEMKCFAAFTRDVTKLDHFEDRIKPAIIKAEKEKDYCDDVEAAIKDYSNQTYIEFRLIFDKDLVLRELFSCEQALIGGGEWSYPEMIGEVFTDDEGYIVLHSLLSVDEYDYLVDMGREAMKKCFPKK